MMSLLQEELFALRDEKYKAFNARLIPTVAPEKIIGVRTPELRKIAKQMIKDGRAENFISVLPHCFHEENLIHGFIISYLKDYDKAEKLLDNFLPFVDNWAVSDTVSPLSYKKNLSAVYRKTEERLRSGHTYTVRYAIVTLMRFFLDDEFTEESLRLVEQVKSEDYYVEMAVAWYFATALAKQWDTAVKTLENRRLSEWVHLKTIQKAIESYRISNERKDILRKLK